MDKEGEMTSFMQNLSFGKMLNLLPGYRSLRNTGTWKKMKHKVTLKTSKRVNDNYTQFMRLPTQYQALNLIIEKYFKCGKKQLNICVFGCSDGSESYSIASSLISNFPQMNFKILSYDIDESVLVKAKNRRYDKSQVFDNKLITKEFIDNTFMIDNETFKVKNTVSEHVEFKCLDILNSERVSDIGSFDLVFSQNFLFHLHGKDVSRAFSNIMSILKDTSVLFIDGIDLDLREKLTLKYNLNPFDFCIEKIHDEARQARGAGWPYHYWGLEPFSKDRSGWERRYSTIFLPQKFD